jgi:hypothetical protein
VPRFMLLLHASTTARAESSRRADIIARYVAWSRAMHEKGKLVLGEKLKDGRGRVLTLRDGPFAEAKELIGGIYILTAKDEDDAVALARTCPHLELGGTIEVREIEEVSRA